MADIDVFQGNWQGEITFEDGKVEELVAEYKGDQFTMTLTKSRKFTSGTQILDESASPKLSIGMVEFSTFTPELVGKKYETIYEFEGSELRIGAHFPGLPPPTNFSPGPSKYIIVLKKV